MKKPPKKKAPPKKAKGKPMPPMMQKIGDQMMGKC